MEAAQSVFSASSAARMSSILLKPKQLRGGGGLEYVCGGWGALLPVDGLADCAGEFDGLVGKPGHKFFDGAVDDVAFLFACCVVVENELRETLLNVW